MKKTFTTALVAVGVAAALSACNPNAITNAAGTTNNHTTSTVGSTSDYTVAQQNAIESAQSYLDMGNGFSRAGLIEQLSSKSGDGFKKSLAVFAVNHINVNWNKQAVMSAKSYLQMGTGFSRAGLIEQLSSKAGDGFTLAQATYAANHVGL